jgi:trigger factor
MPSFALKNYKGVEVEQVKNGPSAKNAEALLWDAIINKVLEANDIEVPQDLMDNEVSMMILEMNHRMKYEGLATGIEIALTPDEKADRLKSIKEEAFKLVKTRLVLKGIIEAENIELSREELQEEANAIAVRQQMPIEMVLNFLGEDLQQLKDDLLVRKAIDFIKANAIIK